VEEHKNGYKKAANEVIGTKTKYRRKKRLRIWKEYIRKKPLKTNETKIPTKPQ